VRFLLDAQLSPALTGLFVEAHHEAVHVRDVGLLSASDREIAAYAAKADMIIATKDEDFMTMRMLSSSSHAPKVVWILIGNATNRVLEARMQPLMPEILAALAAGEEIIEIR
jgi:predicted nuclease of predicted toxin-antitoxin system